jgi:tetratricopeptide (TPR) repeat protein
MRENVTNPKETSVPDNSDPKQTLPGGTESVEQRVAELLTRAEQQMAAQHLITPVGHAALETYQAILELVPGHRDALDGIIRIKEQYLAWTVAARQRGQWVRAQSYAERAATVDPGDSEFAQLLDLIKEERKLMVEVAALKKLEAENAKAAAKLQAEMAALQKLEAENAKAAAKLQAEVKAMRKIAAEELKKTEPQPAVSVQKIDDLLIKAQQQFEVQRLTQPVGDNAWETYQKVLQLDPSNQRAREGFQIIARRLESMARGKQQEGDLPASLAIVEDGLRVWPNHSGLLALKEEINRQIEGQGAVKQVEEQPPPTGDTEAAPEPKTKKRRRVKSFGTFF